ncbi:MAG: zinc ribbon domain-containing protein [Gemmatimonadota bacterium]
MTVADDVLQSFHKVLVEEIRTKRPDYLTGPFTVAEIYQDLVPYPTHRDRIGVEMNGDYEDALIRLLAGEGGYLVLESEHALKELRSELQSKNPNTGVYREYAAVDVRLNPELVNGAGAGGRSGGEAAEGVSGGQGEPKGAAAHGSGDASSAPADEASGAAVATATESGGETCRWCRAPLPARENLNFCPYCGTDVHAVPCAGCGEELEPEWRFCISCGTERPS